MTVTTGNGPTPSADSGEHSKSEVAYRVIRQRILEGVLGPGQRLILGRLADELQISSLPIREALRRLEAEGLVDFTRNIGAVVSGVDPTKYSETLQVLAILEAAATAESARHLTREQLAEARSIGDRMRAASAAEDMRSFTLLNRSFHELICSACPNTYLREMVSKEWLRLDAIRWSAFSMMPGRATHSIDEHDRIVALIEADASPVEIERAAREHKLNTLHAFEARETLR